MYKNWRLSIFLIPGWVGLFLGKSPLVILGASYDHTEKQVYIGVPGIFFAINTSRYS